MNHDDAKSATKTLSWLGFATLLSRRFQRFRRVVGEDGKPWMSACRRRQVLSVVIRLRANRPARATGAQAATMGGSRSASPIFPNTATTRK